MKGESDVPLRLKHGAWQAVIAIDRHLEMFILIGLTVAALILFTLNLGGVALRDWDEGTVAQVAREIGRSPNLEGWLFPTRHGVPYLNKPPLLHWLIAGAFTLGGVNEWMARLPGAGLTALSVPLLYGIGRELFVQRTTAIFGAAVYLTLLPVVRHGRLAMLDGAILCFFLLMLWCLLQSRRNPRWALGVGLGLGLMCMTKGILGILLGAIALGFVLWDAPRLLRSGYGWLGLMIGCAPVMAWYTAQWIHYGPDFLSTHVLDQSLNRVAQTVEGNQGPIWYYLLELLKEGWPWIMFLPMGIRAAWGDRNHSWARLVWVWLIGYLVTISLMQTKLPWYILPLYPAVALVVGVELNRLWHNLSGRSATLTPGWRYRAILIGFFSLLAIVGWAGSLYYGVIHPETDLALTLTLGALALTLTGAIALLLQSNPMVIPLLLWGVYITLLAFLSSNHWVWELGEDYPVQPVAQLIQHHTPPDAVIYTSHPHGRPSLEFYGDRRVIAVGHNHQRLQRQWQRQRGETPYLLLDQITYDQMNFKPSETLGESNGFRLIRRSDGANSSEES